MKINEQQHHIELTTLLLCCRMIQNVSVSPESYDSSSFNSLSLDEDCCNGGNKMMNEKKRRDKYSIVSNRIESNRIDNVPGLTLLS